MGKGKLWKWNENAEFSHVFEPDLQSIVDGATLNKGVWAEKVFGNDHPVVLELGCGKGEYTVGLARRHPEVNFIGVDIKGHRFWRGAKTSEQEGLNNVAFLRTRIEFVQNFFAPNEVSEVWLTFSDPQPKDEKGTKRITSELYLERYRSFMVSGGFIHVKSDRPTPVFAVQSRVGESWFPDTGRLSRRICGFGTPGRFGFCGCPEHPDLL